MRAAFLPTALAAATLTLGALLPGAAAAPEALGCLDPRASCPLMDSIPDDDACTRHAPPLPNACVPFSLLRCVEPRSACTLPELPLPRDGTCTRHAPPLRNVCAPDLP